MGNEQIKPVDRYFRKLSSLNSWEDIWEFFK